MTKRPSIRGGISLTIARWNVRAALALGIAIASVAAGAERVGANLSWTTYEAEAMSTDGEVLGPKYGPFLVEMESSGQRCVRLTRPTDFIEFVPAAQGNAIVVRYSLPDAPTGGGLNATLDLSVNGKVVRRLALTSRYAHLYGTYPFSNDPSQGKPRNFYDELRVTDVSLRRGDHVRLQGLAGAAACIVDFVDVEDVAPPLLRSEGSLSVLDFGATGNGDADDTAALQKAVAAAAAHGGVVWVPPGEFKITGDIVVPSGVRIQGAGMWHTTFVGDEALYVQPDRRVRFRLTGDRSGIADFAIVGKLNYRKDEEPNDGIVGQNCRDTTIARIWIEHTKTGAWIYNGFRVTIDGCRFRDLLADGVNLCVGTAECVVQDCTARGTGDDCFAMWPVPSDQGFVQSHRPGDNVIRHCTGQLPFLANGGAIYGGADNRIEDCEFTDITTGCGILISTTFPTADEARHIDNNFSGTTVVRDCELLRCGGYDHAWAWRAALQLCMDRRSLAGIRISDIAIRDSLSDAISVVGPGSAKGEGTLSDATLTRGRVERVGVGTTGRGLWIRHDAEGSLRLAQSDIAPIANDSTAFTVVR